MWHLNAHLKNLCLHLFMDENFNGYVCGKICVKKIEF